jgi:hypothetical protein
MSCMFIMDFTFEEVSCHFITLAKGVAKLTRNVITFSMKICTNFIT